MTEQPTRGGSIVWELLVPALIGAATGACVAALVEGVEHRALRLLASLPGLTPALLAPLAFLLTFLASRYVTRADAPSTSELYIRTYHQPDGRIPLWQLPGRLLATIATVGLGGSQGFESTSAMIGAAWGDVIGRWKALAVSAETRRSLLASGASAGIAAVFSSPAVGALYGIEVPFKRDADTPRLVPCSVAAVCSYFTRDWLTGTERIVTEDRLPKLDATFLLGCLIVAVLCGLGARLFAWVEELIHTHGKSQPHWLRAVVAGVLLAGLAAAGFTLCGEWITFGSGYVATNWLTAEPRPLGLLGLALAIRAGGNLVSVYGKGGGGVFTSLACNGAFVGQMVAEALGCAETRGLALLGAVCFLGAGYRLPLACALFVLEATGSVAVGAVGLAALAVGQVLMGDASVSDAQADRRTR